MKKLTIAFVLTLLLALFVAPSASAASIAKESESNNTSNTADVIKDGMIRGSLSNEDDVDFYKFDANKDYFELTFKLSDINLSANVEDGWDITIYNKDMQELLHYTTENSFTTPRMPISGTIYVKVQAKVASPYWAPIGIYYDISFTNTTDKYWESESNDSSTKANAITAGKVYHGSLQNKDDADWFKTTSADYFNVTFNANNKIDTSYDVEDGWTISLYDSKLNLLTSFNVKTTETSFNYPVTGTVYVKVEAETVSDYWAPLHVYYDLKVNSVTNSKWENEYNDTSKTATTIKQGTTYIGNLQSKDDVDYFKVKSTSKAFAIKFDIRLDEVDADAVDDGWKISVYPEKSSSAICTFTVDTLGSTQSVTLPYAKGGYYYVKVEAAVSSDYWAPIGQTYHISVVDASEKHNWEVEKGTTGTKSATTLNEASKIYGNLYDGDTDYFKCNIPTGGTINVKFNRETADDDGYGYLVKVINSAGKVIEKMTIDDAKSGKLTKVKVSKGTYYIVVTNAGYRDPGADINYNVSYELTMAKPTAKLSSTSNTVKVSWDKRSDVAGYQIEYSTNKDFKNSTVKKITKNSTTSFTIKKASASKAYYVRMRTFIKVDGEYRYSGWSTVVSTTTTTSVKSASTTKNTLKVTWDKHSGATGYQVQYSTSKSFKNPTTKTISKNSTLTHTFKKLSANKTYYVRVRTITKVDGKTYYSSWSSAVTCTTSAPSVKKITPDKNSLKVTWDKSSVATGYQVEFSTKKDFSSNNIKDVHKTNTSVSLKNLISGKTYYVRVRIVITDKATGLTTYSPWSAVSSMKVK